MWHIEKSINKENSTKLRSAKSHINKLKSLFEKYQLTIIDYTGEAYNEGLNIDIIATETNPNAEKDTIKESLNPSVFINNTLIKKSKVILEIKGEEND